jgi:glucokinase
MAIVGVDLGGTKLSAALFAEEGELLLREVEGIGGREGADVGRLISELVEDTVEKAHDIGHAVQSVGMCVPGIYYPDSGKVWAPNIPGWDDYPLLDELTTSLDTAVHIESDRSCYILGEIWQGAARGCTDAIFLAVGTGIGAGIVSGGRVVTGKHGIAGAIGWLALDRPYRGVYDACGCFEYQASGEGLSRVAADLREEEYRGASEGSVDARAVFEAYEAGDPLATRVVENAVELWGMAVANLVSLFNPEIIIFGGGVFGPAVVLIDSIRAEAEKWAQPISIREVTLEPSQLGSDAGLYGAAKLAKDSHD